MTNDIASDIEQAAGLIERQDWRACGRNSLTGATHSFGACAYVREVIAPGEHLNDGTRTNKTADEVLSGMAPDAAAAFLRGVALRAAERGAVYVGGAIVERGQ